MKTIAMVVALCLTACIPVDTNKYKYSYQVDCITIFAENPVNETALILLVNRAKEMIIAQEMVTKEEFCPFMSPVPILIKNESSWECEANDTTDRCVGQTKVDDPFWEMWLSSRPNALLHEWFHVAEMKHGVSFKDSSNHKDWIEKGYYHPFFEYNSFAFNILGFDTIFTPQSDLTFRPAKPYTQSQP